MESERIKKHNREEKKKLGAFYSPAILGDFLAHIMLSISNNSAKKNYVVLDPATGNSDLLVAFDKATKSSNLYKYIGIDIDDLAISNSQRVLAEKSIDSSIIKADAIYPIANKNSKEGWEILRKQHSLNNFDFIISNPPWGADKSKYQSIKSEYKVAKGQFDIYDIFVELIINLLSENGVYGIILPDSIYSQEHFTARKKILEETSLKYIVRLGEGFFDGVNTSITIIAGKKEANEGNVTKCIHLNRGDIKGVMSNALSLTKMVEEKPNLISQEALISHNYAFLTDIYQEDRSVISKIEAARHIKDIAVSSRGVELSKKGYVTECPYCHHWAPMPSDKTKNTIFCPNCNSTYEITSSKVECIVTTNGTQNSERFIAGEDIYRYFVRPKSYIKLGYKGLNYKDGSIYTSPKILVRKTGVGLTVGIDYNGCYTNQVVYILRKKDEIQYLTNELIIAILNSRALTYYYIKKYGENGWRSHPYITQKMLMDLPFPEIRTKRDRSIVASITDLVEKCISKDKEDISITEDSKIEFLVAKLFGLNQKDYRIIYKTIENAQKMIPFKRLLKIGIKDIFSNGL